MFNISDLHVEASPQPKGGMSTGKLPAGVKVTHIPTQLSVTVDKYRHMQDNRKAAIRLAFLEAAKHEINIVLDELELNHAYVDMDNHEYMDMPQVAKGLDRDDDCF